MKNIESKIINNPEENDTTENNEPSTIFTCTKCGKTFPKSNRIWWNKTEENCYNCILDINKINLNLQKNEQNNDVIEHTSSKRKLSFAYAPASKWRIIEGKPTNREIFLKTSRRLIKRKIRKRKRLKNNLPCNINKTYLIKAGHLSNKEFNEQCSTSSMQCKKAKQCYVHEGRTNLKKLRHLLKR